MIQCSSSEQPPPRIMLVDDTPANLELLTSMLKEQGYKTQPLLNGAQALAAADKAPPDLILLDVSMPGMDGFEVCRAFKANPRLADIPVIFISARTDTEDKVHGFRAGGVDYINKPFQFEEVEARVRAHLQLQTQKQKLQESYERLRQMEETRDGLVHMIVHDMRGLLQGITWSLAAINSSELSEANARRVRVATSSSRRLADLINCILDVSKMEAGQMTLDLQPCDVACLTQEVLKDLQAMQGQRHVWLEGGPCEVIADGGLLYRVMQNLLTNALKFTDSRGSVCVRVAPAQDGREVMVSVIDDGMGIPKDLQERVFDKFVQFDSLSARGTGIGLAFCRLVITAHGGTIAVESTEGRGTTFWFTLPARAAIRT